jgi:hypothetical protein
VKSSDIRSQRIGRKPLDIKGQRFGRLVALERLPENAPSGNAVWRFQCDCGRETVKTASTVKSGDTKSCGCLQQENYVATIMNGGRRGVWKSSLVNRYRAPPRKFK